MMSFATRVKQLIEERCDQSYIEKCKRYIDHHLHLPITLDDLAQEVDISKTYTGMTPRQYRDKEKYVDVI